MTLWKHRPLAEDFPLRPALFLDRDGVIIADENYLADPDKVRLLPGVAPALRRARDAGFLLVGVSNQSGIGRGFFKEEDFQRVMLRLEELLAAQAVVFDSFHYCPHSPAEGCNCRKPLPGMLEEARALLPIDLSRSWMVGDKSSDVAFGRDANLGAALVRTGYGPAEEAKVAARWGKDPRVLVADDLAGVVERILAWPESVVSP